MYNTIINNETKSKFINKLTKEILEMDSNSFDLERYEDKVYQFFKKNEINCTKQEQDEFIHNTVEKISYCKQNDNYKIAQELIQRYFLRTFGSQIQCLKDLDNSANVCLTIKGKDISICFQDNKCVEWQAEYNVLHEAFLLDDPFVLDNLSDYPFTTRGISADLERKIIDAENDIMEGLFEAIVAKENLKDIYNVLNKVIEGDILLQYGEGELKVDQFKEPLSFENLSAGLKSFVLIKILLEKGILKEKDVLILDEPEIHLHPEWQLYYAEIIVLLQRKFDLSIVVTTHSMNFLEAIELYAKKHDLISKCKFYKTNMENGLAVFEDVTDSLDKIYRQMVTPSMLLDKLRYEMEEDNE